MSIEDLFHKKEPEDDKVLIPELSGICTECWWPMDVYFVKNKKQLVYICENNHVFKESTEVNWLG